MSEVTRLLNAVDLGEPNAANDLLPLVYTELRRLAAKKMAQETERQTLQPTALVHEAFLRLVDNHESTSWDGRRHFFGAAAEAMRRILIERARARHSLMRGGEFSRVDLETVQLADEDRGLELLALDEALQDLERFDLQAAELVKLRYYAGFGHQEAAEMLGIGRRAADRLWVVARAWLYDRLSDL